MASPRTPHRGPGLPGVVLGHLSAWVDGNNELDGCDGECTWLKLGDFGVSNAVLHGKLGTGDFVRILALVVVVSLGKTEIVHAGIAETKVASWYSLVLGADEESFG